MKVKSESEIAQSCPIHSDPTDCSLPGSSVHVIFQVRVLEWGAIAFSKDANNCLQWFMVEVSIKIFEISYVNMKRKIGAVFLILTMKFLGNAFIFHSTLSSLFPLSLSLVLKNKCIHKYAGCRKLTFSISNKNLGE